ncbi:hypothetical protein H0H92_016097 [Tricholoma furcatifolium]|nr:hypothetical protein H0H92_016097 [Tricholoma furcatifolium]
MSLNAANGSGNMHGTPARNERLPFPQSSNPSPAHPQTPQRQTTSSHVASASHSTPFSTTPSSSSSAVNKDRPLTSAYLLKANANTSDPKLAALEQAVNDRNALSAQNAQLWKLIEKQRSGYNQILKELERVRGERDALKAKLGGSASGREERRHRGSDADRSTKRSFSENVSIEEKGHSKKDSKGHDDQATPRSVTHPQLHPSRSHEPLSAHDNSLQSNANTLNPLGSRSQTLSIPPPPMSAPSAIDTQLANSNARSAKPSPTSLVVLPRLESLPIPSSPLISASQESNIFGQQATANEPKPPATYNRKSSLTKTPLLNVNHSPFTPPSQQYNYNGGLTPQTAPAGFGSSSSDAYMKNATTASAAPSSALLTTIPEGRAGMLSRDSRISLPDEAKQYIANMTESPVPSPRVDVFGTKPTNLIAQSQVSPHTTGLVPPAPASVVKADSPGASSEFLDLNEDEEDEEDDEDEGVECDEIDEEESVLPVADGVADPSSHLLETPRKPTQPSPHLDHQTQVHVRPKPRIDVDLFPFPPPTSVQSQSGMVFTQQPASVAPVYGTVDHISPLENPYSPPAPNQHGMQPLRLESQPMVPVPANFRALPLLASDLPHTIIIVSHSFVRPNDRGKEVLSFVISVNPGPGKEGWKVEKMYSDVLGLDQRIRSALGKPLGKKIPILPEGKLWKDHAPAKVDQRKAVLENYLQMLVNLPVKDNHEVVAFLTSDVVRETMQPVMQVGHKEGYLTKRGKNFGGWKTRYFVLQGPVLEYYDCRGGAHLGSIQITGAQIGRQQQQRSDRTPSTDEENEYRHAFLIVEAKKGQGGGHARHVLCAESDADRDAWVDILVRYYTGVYSEEATTIKHPPSSFVTSSGQPRSSTSSSVLESPTARRPSRGFSKDDISISKGAAVPISQLAQDQSNAKLFPPASYGGEEYARSPSPSKNSDSPIDPQNSAARKLLERGQGLPSSLPDSSPLPSVSNFNSDASVSASQRANSELGHYADLGGRSHRQTSPERHRTRDPHDKHKSFYPSAPSPVERVPSPEKLDASSKPKISGPLHGAVIPSGFKFGGKDAPSTAETAASDRRIKSRSFWGFGKPNGDKSQAIAYVPRAVFGIPLEESLDVAQIANLPAIVFRSIQYLEAKKAEQEEGIYRLSGSSAVIKSLKDRFNMEGDVDLLASDEYWDPHAIAGLLKSFLRELPASILTRDLHLRFLAVMDFVDAQERIRELSQLIAALPLANYSLLRALTAHLILIVQNSSINKMTMRNVGIVFSPTLGIPAGVFSLMLGEFNRVFNVDAGTEGDDGSTADNGDEEGRGELDRRNSKHYSDAAADQLLGLTGRTLKAPTQEAPSDVDGDEGSVHEESGTETTDGDFTVESSSESGDASQQVAEGAIQIITLPPDSPETPVGPKSSSRPSKASHVAATRGLNVNVTGTERGNRHSKLIGLPTSPRPFGSSRQADVPPASPSRARE